MMGKEQKAMSITERLKALFGHRPARTPESAMPGMIACEEALAALYEYLDGELAGASHDRVKAHFDVCAACYPKLRVEESFRLAVRKATRGERTSRELRDRVREALARAEAAGEDG